MLRKIFEVSFRMHEIPSIWLCAIVASVFKKGSSSDVKNYRPISLTCIASKVMERIVRNEILSYLLSHKLISVKKHGFLARRSTGTQLLECMNTWTKYVDRDKLCIDVVTSTMQKRLTPCPRKR